MTQARTQDRDQLALMAELSQSFAESLDIETTLRNAVRKIVSSLDAEAGSVFLLDGSDLVCRACDGPVDVAGLRFPATRGIVGRAVTENACQLVRDVSRDKQFDGTSDSDTGFTTRSTICTPLNTAAGPIGAIQVLNKKGGGRFDDRDRDLLRVLASPTALAINNARMADDLVEQRRIRRELQLARRLQRTLLPARRKAPFPVLGVNVPARETSGDFYDYFDLPDGRIAFTLGDVSGKGVDASLLMVRATSLLRLVGKDGMSPEDWLNRVNGELGDAIDGGRFVCALAGYYDPYTTEAVWANAGLPPVVLQAADGALAHFEATAPPLGILESLSLEAQRVSLRDARLYFFTDGVGDAKTAEGERIDLPGFDRLLTEYHEYPPKQRLGRILSTLRRGVLADDTTLLLLESRRTVGGSGYPLLDWQCASSPKALKEVRRKVRETLVRVGCGGEELNRLVLAVDEACANIIRHAYGGDESRSIQIRVERLAAELIFKLRDWAAPVDPQKIAPRRLEDYRPGGLGVHFIDSVMSSRRYVRPDDGEGNLLIMTHRIADE